MCDFGLPSAGSGALPSPHDAVAMALAGLGALASADLASVPAGALADILRGLEKVRSVHVAAHAGVLAAFTRQAGYTEDGHGSPRSWLTWQTGVARTSASASLAWMDRLGAHPAVVDALAAAQISQSYARAICDWSDLLPGDARDDADAILIAAARGGASLRDLTQLVEEIRARTARPDTDTGPDPSERWLVLRRTCGGAGRVSGDLTPECASALEAVLESLGKRADSNDMRSKTQRDHDALLEALTRLIGSRCLPERAGQPVQIQLHMKLADLLGGTGTPGRECDAQIAPVVSGTVDHDLLDQLSRRLAGTGDGPRDARQLILANAIALLSGPGQLASLLRTGTLPGPAASISLPLDLGKPTETIPPHLRRAVILRDQHCAAPGCDQPPAVCDVHHIQPRSQGGPTKITNLLLLCRFHHLIMIHEWGWTIRLNPDGTTTTTSPDGSRSYHSHAPPRRAAA